MTNFSIDEFERSITAREKGIDNAIPYQAKKNILLLISKILQPARDRLALPIFISSGYRSKALNKAVGGSSSSQHLTGEAADITCSDNDRLLQILKDLPYDQLIVYRNRRKESEIMWIHVSYSEKKTRSMSYSVFK